MGFVTFVLLLTTGGGGRRSGAATGSTHSPNSPIIDPVKLLNVNGENPEFKNEEAAKQTLNKQCIMR